MIRFSTILLLTSLGDHARQERIAMHIVDRSTSLIRFLKKTGRLALGLATVFALTSCDKWVYSSAELESKRKFESVDVGRTEHDLILAFGAPDLLIKRDKGSGQLMCERNSISKACDAFGSVDELKFLPRNKVGQKVYVYVEGSVFSYYFVGSNGLVEALDVFVT